ncbi:pilus assembly protein Flp/PilA [Palleronia aestuarii]|uniref:Pilus assembly protein Flp/PilA n=1 Tax=Palleronia aestuarii TaxID=568105 RepID=A0A2W7MYD5_9RHOB|nr:Flp family type IVb pilin [Palleronia aestuarii]PZX13115.1 pilus assembly protein Flp/PilA [Palleronia aestuarii]
MTNLIARFKNDESGATAIEYGLIAGLVSIVIIAGLQLAGPALNRIFLAVGNTLNDNAPAAAGG